MRFTPYTPADFLAVRDVLAASFRHYPAPENWLIDRWSMVGYAGRVFNGLDEAAWAAGIGLWRDGMGRIAAMVNEEEGHGDDVSIVDRAGEVKSFANVWYDSLNRLGVLEPAGTVPDVQGRGFGRAVVHEVLIRVERLGVRAAYVVSELPFHAALGFESVLRSPIWELAVP